MRSLGSPLARVAVDRRPGPDDLLRAGSGSQNSMSGTMKSGATRSISAAV